jgi:DNA-binding response OmpR family regulator
MSTDMRILVVEDEIKLAANVCAGLRAVGFCADHAPALADARTLAATVSYEAIILDLGLPDGNGLDLLRAARRNGASMGVLALTARDGSRWRGRDRDVPRHWLHVV